MAKGDFTSIRIDGFQRGINLVDRREQLSDGYLAPNTKNVVPVGQGKSIKPIDDIGVAISLANSTTRRPAELTAHKLGLFVGYADGSVDRIDYAISPSPVSYAATDATGIPVVVVSQDSALTTYYAYILRPSGSGATSVKVNMSTNASVTWPGTPPQGEAAISWKTRMIIGHNNRVSFSTESNPDSWPANNFIDIKTLDDDRDYIVGFEVLGEDLIVLKQRSVWLVFDPVSFDNRRLFSVGLLNRRCVARGTNRIFWMDTAGVYSTEGSELKYEAENIDPLFSNPLTEYGNAFYYNPPIFKLWPNGVPAPNASLTVTASDTVVIGDGSGSMFVGYSTFRGADARIPWYSIRGSNIPVAKDLLFVPFDDGTGQKYPVVLGAIQETTNHNHISVMFGFGVNSGLVLKDGVAMGPEPVIEFPVVHNQTIEDWSRLRRLTLYGEGVLAEDSSNTLQVYKDDDTSASFQANALSFTDNFIRVRPEVRARSFVVKLSGTGQSTARIHSVEALFRRAGI